MITGRFFYILSHAVKQSKKLTSDKQKGWLYRWRIVADMMLCYHKYRMYTNEYLSEHLYEKNSAEKSLVGEKYREKGIKREMWIADFERTRKFLSKYSQFKYEIGARRVLRNKAYMKFFHTGDLLYVEYDVNISRQHGLDGELKIGRHVLLSKHATLDYSGGLTIGNDVQITDGVHILTHDHKHHHVQSSSLDIKNNDIKTPLTIADGCVLGSKCVILPSCNYIGKYARIGAGAVVTHDIPDYAIAVGVPAKVVGQVPLSNEAEDK